MALESSDEEAKVAAMQKAITAILAGEQFPALFITIVRYVLPSENHMVQKLLLLYLVSQRWQRTKKRVWIAVDRCSWWMELMGARCMSDALPSCRRSSAAGCCPVCRRRSRRRMRPASCCQRWCAGGAADCRLDGGAGFCWCMQLAAVVWSTQPQPLHCAPH